MLADPFLSRIAAVRDFFDGEEPALILAFPPDLGRMLRKLLLRMEAEPDNRHVMIPAAVPFEGYRPFFDGVLASVADQVERHRNALGEVGVEVPGPPEPEPPRDAAGKDAPRDRAEGVAAYLSSLARALPSPEVGSLVLVLDPPAVHDAVAFGWSVGALAHYLGPGRVKLLVLDGAAWASEGVADEWTGEVARIDFAVRSGELEDQVHRDLASGRLNPTDSRRHRLLAGAFASSAARFEEAEAHLKQALEECARSGAGAEQAVVLHGLGTMYLRTGRHEEAGEVLSRAASLCLEHGATPLLGMVLNDLGVAIHHMGRTQDAGRTFSQAGRLFRALGHKPGEAHVLDSAARSLAAVDRTDEARDLWTQALQVYRSIRASHLSRVREGGMEQIEARLSELEASRREP